MIYQESFRQYAVILSAGILAAYSTTSTLHILASKYLNIFNINNPEKRIFWNRESLHDLRST